MHPRRIRLSIAATAFLVLAFYAGFQFRTLRPSAPQHPITSRQIAGIATDQRWLDRVAREQQEQPELALDLIGVSSGMTVADVGAGTGYMTFRIASRVGTAGKVYATDLQPAMLTTLDEKRHKQNVGNIETVLGTETDARLPENAIDLALLVDVYHEFSHPQPMLRSIRRSLKPDGRLVMIEYRKEDPNLPIAATHKMSVQEIRTELEAEGFALDRIIEDLPRQHILVFTRQ